MCDRLAALAWGRFSCKTTDPRMPSMVANLTKL